MAELPGILQRAMVGMRFTLTGNAPSEWFGPGTALAPQAPPAVAGRNWDFPSFTNTSYIPRKTEPVGFRKLKLLATNCEPLKLVMARQRALMAAMEWSIKPKKKTASGDTQDPAVALITEFFEYPDRHHDWAQWLNALLDQVFVYDALSIYDRRTVGGGLWGLEILDGATISPLLDAWGRVPMAPDVGYQQVLKGLPAVQYTTEELLYYPENYRVDHIYGNSRVERVITIVETMIAQMQSQLGYFTHGNVGDGFFTAPDQWQPDQIAQFEVLWNAQMGADGGARIADRRQAPWLPFGAEYHPTKVELFTSGFEEWLIRLICFTFDVSPMPFLKQTGLGHGSGQTDKEAAEEGGVAQLMQMIRRLMNRLIATKFERPDLEFSWTEDRELDPEVASVIQDRKLRNGSLVIDDARDQDGKAALPNGLGATPLIYTAQGAVTIDSILNPPEPPPVVVAAPGAVAPGAKPPAANDDGKKQPLAKAAADNETRLAKIITTFLKARAAAIAPGMADALGLAKADEGVDKRIDQAFDDEDWDWSGLASAAEPVIVSIAVAKATDAVGELGLFDKPTLARVTARATAWAHNRAAELVGMKWVDGELVVNPDAAWSISDSTRNMLRSSIETAMEEGQSNSELAKTIREDAAFSKDRASTIARSETAMADIKGSIAGWRASGLVEGRQWLASDGCCDICQDLDGTVVGIDEEFPEGDLAHPNCECSQLPVLAEDMPDTDTETD